MAHGIVLMLRFKVKFDVRGFGPDDLKVSASKNRLTVHGKKSKKTDTSLSSSEFCRTVYLPNSVDEEQFKCHFTGDGVLMLEAPVKVSDYQSLTFSSNEPQLAVKPVAEGSLALQVTGVAGLTVVDDGAGGQKLHVEVPIDAEYSSADLLVHTGANRIVVSGRKQVIEGSGASQCSHWKEFSRTYNAPETVDPLSVKSELHGSVLVVEGSLVKLP
ncbi:unnamed protein product [Dicrocoelium dendriticum]|nr:unnamed protein product [Dicrocoelium dendriticum]